MPKHLKKGVMIIVTAYFIEIVVFTRHSQNFLGVAYSLVSFRILAEKDTFEWHHP